MKRITAKSQIDWEEGKETGRERERRNTTKRICENKLFESLRASSTVSAVHEWLCGCADDMVLLNPSEQEMNVENQTQLDWETGEGEKECFEQVLENTHHISLRPCGFAYSFFPSSSVWSRMVCCDCLVNCEQASCLFELICIFFPWWCHCQRKHSYARCKNSK